MMKHLIPHHGVDIGSILDLYIILFQNSYPSFPEGQLLFVGYLKTNTKSSFIIAMNEQIQNIAQKKDTLCRMMYN